MAVGPEQLLLLYYEQSFPRILGTDLPFATRCLKDFCSLQGYVQSRCRQPTAKEVLARLEHYKQETAPSIKAGPLLKFLKDCRLEPLHLLDFGCAEGHIVRYLSLCIPSLITVQGIDVCASVLQISKRLCQSAEGSIPKQRWNRNLDEALIKDQTLDLIIVMHTLHHVDETDIDRILNQLLCKLAPGGLLYIYEDSWTSSGQISISMCPELDLCFNQLPIEQKLQMFLLNEQWSNGWCYRRFLNAHTAWYRPLEGWTRLLKSKGIEIISKGTVGFDTRRLHGVPSAWLIGTKHGQRA